MMPHKVWVYCEGCQRAYTDRAAYDAHFDTCEGAKP